MTSGRPHFFRRANLPALALILLVALLLFVSARSSRPPEPLPFDLDSTAATGLAALDRWLQALGYDVRRLGGFQFELPADADLLFVYPNQLTYSAAEAAALREWVAAGRTLVLVGPDAEDRELARVFGVSTQARGGFGVLDRQTQPLAPEGAAEYISNWSAGSDVLDLAGAPTAVPMLQTDRGEIVAAVQALGDGVVWHLAPANAFANRALREDNQGELLPPVLRRVPAGGTIAFDTYHQFGVSRVGERIATLQDWLYRTPGGWATLFTVGTLMVYLLLQGRRLGPPLVSAAERRRREAAEYVEAMAALSRRANLRGDVARYQAQRLKRGLARRRPLDPNLSDAEFLSRLAYADPPADPDTVAAVSRTLAGLRGSPNEQQLVAFAAQIDELIQR
jgi:hypothetical protein